MGIYMANSNDLRRRLERLRRGTRSPQAEERKTTSSWVDLPQGEEILTDDGSTYRIENVYPADYQHGLRPLEAYLDFDPQLASRVASAPELEETDPRGWLFLDLETTGLAGGAGTMSFLVGIGSFTDSGFRLRQYLLRDPQEESSMLQVLSEDLQDAQAFISFNGKVFDLPLLEMRYMLALRQHIPLNQRPHLDLLFPSRRLWRSDLPNCRLGTLEQHVLQVTRSEEDVPGEEIPGIYMDYLRTGDITPLRRVIYHNAIDILSLVGLTAHVLDRHQPNDPLDLTGGEALAVARWHQRERREGDAETIYRVALEGGTPKEVQVEALRRYSLHLRRRERREEAVPLWERWHELAPADPAPCIELAKHYEWQRVELDTALKWAKKALTALTHWPAGWQRDRQWEAVEHRITRLKRKQENA